MDEGGKPLTPLRVLIIDDSDDDAQMVLRTMQKGGFGVSHRRVDTTEAMQTALEREPWDIVLCDYVMPRFSAPQALSVFQQYHIDIPFIVVSGAVGEETAVEVMKAGAHDYVLKQNLIRLVPAIKRELREAEERSARRRAEKELSHRALYDGLTGLPNQTLLLDRLNQATAYAKRDNRKLAVMFLDIDRFKNVNDTYGRTAGDRLLYGMAERLRGILAEEDTAARVGGNKFVVLVAKVTTPEEAFQRSEYIRQTLNSHIEIDGQELHLGLSIGIAIYPDSAEDSASLIRFAEAAMYEIKEHGGNSSALFSKDIDLARHRRFLMENNLRRALKQGEFELVYQPQASFATGKVTGVEALLRWRDPNFGLIMPDRFIPLAEETGLILPIGEWAVGQVCRDFAHWKENHHAPDSVAVNLSVKQLQDVRLLRYAKEAQDLFRSYNGNVLELEVTEGGLMRDPAGAAAILGMFKTMGISIALDDFGTGYSSLAYLKDLPIDVLKIDKSFLVDVAKNPNDQAIVTSIIALARSLRLRVVAEGVETEEQRAFLQRSGCDTAQGYLVSKPLTSDQLEDFMAANAVQSMRPGGTLPTM